MCVETTRCRCLNFNLVILTPLYENGLKSTVFVVYLVCLYR